MAESCRRSIDALQHRQQRRRWRPFDITQRGSGTTGTDGGVARPRAAIGVHFRLCPCASVHEKEAGGGLVEFRVVNSRWQAEARASSWHASGQTAVWPCTENESLDALFPPHLSVLSLQPDLPQAPPPSARQKSVPGH